MALKIYGKLRNQSRIFGLENDKTGSKSIKTTKHDMVGQTKEY